MPKEDLLINIDIETKQPRRGVEELNEALSENAKQAKKIQKEIQALEKQYKSIATAIGKLPVSHVDRLNKEVKSNTKAVRNMEDQMQRVGKRIEVVRERTIDASDAFVALTATMLAWGKLEAPIRFTNQIVKAAQAVLVFNREVAPMIRDTIRLTQRGFERLAQAVGPFKEAMLAVGPALREQIQLLNGVHLAAVRTGEFIFKFNESLTALSRGASHINRALVGVVAFFNTTREGLTRVTRLFRTFGEGVGTTIKILSELGGALSNTFGASSAGAAQVGFFQKQLLNIEYTLERTVKAFNNAKTQARAFGKVLIDESGRSIKGFMQMVEEAGGLGAFMRQTMSRATAFMASELVKLGTSSISFSQKLGIVKNGIIGLIESGHIFGATLIGFGSYLKKSENDLVAFVGKALQIFGIFSFGFATAFTFALGAISSGLMKVGDFFLRTMSGWEAKFEKLQRVTQSFEFTVRGFGKAIGEAAVGSLSFWGDQIDALVKTTSFGVGEIQKSIKILIAEGTALGITVDQNAVLLKTAADLAASTGNDLSQVTLAIARGLAGNAASLQDMGVFVGQAALQHGKYAEAMGLVVNQMSKEERAQLVFKTILEQTRPIMGAAANDLNTITGANTQYEKSVDTLLAKLGSQHTLFISLTRIQTAFIQALSYLPDIFLDVISSLVDVLGVGFKVIGMFLGMFITIESIRSGYQLLSWALRESTVAQIALNTVLGVAAGYLNVQMIAVTSLNAAFIMTGRIIKAAVIQSFATLNTMLIGAITRLTALTTGLFFTSAGWASMASGAAVATKAVLGFTAAVVTSPIFIIGSAIFLIVKAFDELSTELKQLQGAIEDTESSAIKATGVIQKLGAVFASVLNGAINLAKLVVIGFLKIAAVTGIVTNGFSKLFAVITGSDDAFARADENIRNILDDIEELDNAANLAVVNVVSVFDKTALAADAAGYSVDTITEKVRGFSEALQKVNFDPESLRISVLGDEFDRAKEAFLEATAALNRARDIGIEEDGKRRIATEKELADLTKARYEKQLELEKLRRDTLRDVERTANDLSVKALENSGKEIEAIKKRHSLELKEFNDRIASMEKIAQLTDNELKAVNKVRAAMASAAKLDIERAEVELADKRKKDLEKIRDEYEKYLKLLQDLSGELRKIRRENLESSEQVAALARLDYDMKLEELKLLEQRLLLQDKFAERGLDGAYRLRSEYQEILDISRKMAAQKLQAALPFTAGDLVDVLGDAFGTAKKFAGDLFSGDLFKNIKLPSLDDLANIGSNIKKAVLDIDLKKVGSLMADGLMEGAALLAKLFDPAVISGLADSVTGLANLPNELGKAFNMLAGALDKFLAMFPEAASNILKALPGLIQRVLDRLPEFIEALADGLVALFDRIPHLVARILDALPGLIAKLMAELPRIVLSLFQSVGLIIGQVIKALPGMFVEILEYADEFAAALVEGVIAGAGDIVVALVDFFIGGGLEKIVAAILRAIPRIAGALVSGFLKGIQRAMGSIFGGIQLPEELTELPNQFAEGVQKLASRTTEEASKLFKVLDLEAEARGLEQANKIQDILNQGILAFEIKFKGLIDWLLEAWRKIVEWVKGVFEWVINGIKNVFQWVVDNVLTPLANVIRTAFQWVIDNVINPLINGITNAWKAIKKDILDPLLNGLKDVFSYLKTKVLDPFMTAFGTVINFLKDKVFDPFMTAFSKALDPDNFVKIGDKIWQGLKKGLETVGTVIQNALNVINPANLFSKMFQMDYQGQGLVERTLGIDIPFANFAKGGMVPGQAVVNGDSLLNDRVLALLSPGEAVIPRSKMDDPRVNSIVNAILRGELMPSNFAKGGLAGTLQSIGGGLLSTLSGAVSGVLGAAAGPIVQALSPESFGRLATAIEGGFDPRRAGIGQIGAIVGSFADAQKVMDALGTTVSGIGKGSLDSITSTVELAKKGADNALQAMEQLKYLLSPQDMWALVKEKVFSGIIKMFEANRFHSGGLVPGFAFGGEVPAMLQPGEFVINKAAVQGLGLGTLSNLNRGMMTGNQEFNFDIKLEVNADGVPDESFIRQRLVPTLKKELKEASLRGEFVISNKGIRQT